MIGDLRRAATWRMLMVCGLCLVATLGLGAAMLATGDYPVSLGELVSALTGRGEGLVATVVLEWRMPRAVLAALGGAALGVSGAIFQSLTRNPLGSPDIVGFAAGSYTGALLTILLVGSGYGPVALGALGGGLLTALAVYLLSYKSGVQGFRLIVVGIGVSAMLTSVNTWMLLRQESDLAMSAAVWGAGSLNAVGWDQVLPCSAAILVLFGLTGLVARGMHQLELGDDVAASTGLAVERTRLLLVLLGVALTAAVTAVAGPIAFIALAAPQIGRRLARSPGNGLAPAAATGAVLLTGADLAAQRLFAPAQWPVGVMAVSIGGLYLLWLLVGQARQRA